MSYIKQHEQKNVRVAEDEKIHAIIANAQAHKSALSSINYLIAVYAILSFLAAAELTASTFFYTSSLGVNFWAAIIFCALLCFGFHMLLHFIGSDTAEDWIFKKQNTSTAMRVKMLINSVLAFILLGIAALFVCFVGKSSYMSYHELRYTPLAQTVSNAGITADNLTNKQGKISNTKLELFTAANTAQTDVITAQTAAEQQHHNEFKISADNVTDIIGSTAFILEATLLLLWFAIASSKRAAVIHVIAEQERRKEGVTNNKPLSNSFDLLDSNFQNSVQDTQNKSIFGTEIGFKYQSTNATQAAPQHVSDVLKNVITKKETVITSLKEDDAKSFEYGDSVLFMFRQKFNNYINKLDKKVGLERTNKMVLIETLRELKNTLPLINTTEKPLLELLDIIEKKVKPILVNFQTEII